MRRAAISAGHVPAVIALRSRGWSSPQRRRRRARPSMLEAPDYLRDSAAIYERSFAIIRAEADLSRFSREEAEIAVRMIHACGQVSAAAAIEFAPGLVEAARAALKRGAP